MMMTTFLKFSFPTRKLQRLGVQHNTQNSSYVHISRCKDSERVKKEKNHQEFLETRRLKRKGAIRKAARLI
jgi:hypothetical protein